MTQIRVGMNKVLGILTICLAGLNLVTFSLTAQRMYGVLSAVFLLMGVLQMFASLFVVELAPDGSGEVLIKNPLGMTLRRHAFGSLADLQVVGSKLHVTRTDGKQKKLGGLSADGGDMVRLAAALDARRRAA